MLAFSNFRLKFRCHISKSCFDEIRIDFDCELFRKSGICDSCCWTDIILFTSISLDACMLDCILFVELDPDDMLCWAIEGLDLLDILLILN